MTNPRELVEAVVADLQSVPDLASLRDNIQAYDDQSPTYRNPDEAIDAMVGTGILVLWNGTNIGYRGASPRWKHQPTLVMKAAGCMTAGKTTSAITPWSAP